MNTWIQLGVRYVNLDNVTEVRIEEMPRKAHLFFVSGGVLELDEDDTRALEGLLQQEAIVAHPVRRTISAPKNRP
jgi:hypothetical protein